MSAIRPLHMLCAALAALSLSACGAASLGAIVNGVGSETTFVRSTQPGGPPALVASLPSRGAQGTLAITGTNQGVVTFQTADGISLALDNGFLVSTRGLGEDLMSSQVADAQRAVLSGGQSGSHPRIHAYLNGFNKIRYTTFLCETSSRQEVIDLSSGTRRSMSRVEEACANPSRGFTNIYWLVDGGTVRKSRQWVGEEVGYMELERL